MQKLICDINITLIQAMRMINENAKGILFVIGKSRKLCGIITDGDIRRFILEGGKLEDRVDKCINKSFTYAFIGESHESYFKKITDQVKIIPLLNSSFEVVDYFEFKTDLHVPVATPDLRGNELKYLLDAFLSTWISSTGTYINRFESSFSSYCETKYGVAVSNGSVALHLALVTLGIGHGDEVIVPDFTFAATINAVLHANATPVIVDIEKDSWCIDPNEVEKAITKNTKAIIPVHIYGQPCDMGRIMSIADKNNLFVIEDCAQAHGAKYKGKKVGSFGDISCFSFYANKVITTGEGGMCLTSNRDLYLKMQVLRDHGMNKSKRYWHDLVGYNYRMTNLQAAIGLAQLERIDKILQFREKVEKKYKNKLSSFHLLDFQKNDFRDRTRITWLVSAIINSRRDKFIDIMNKKGIDIRPFFYSLSSMDIYKKYVYSNEISQIISSKGVNFPTNISINDSTLDKVLSLSKQFTNVEYDH